LANNLLRRDLLDISPALNEAASAIVDVSIYILSLSEWKYLEKVGNPKEDGAPSASGYRLGEILLLISVLCFHSLFEGIAIVGYGQSSSHSWLWQHLEQSYSHGNRSENLMHSCAFFGIQRRLGCLHIGFLSTPLIGTVFRGVALLLSRERKLLQQECRNIDHHIRDIQRTEESF